MNIFTNITYRLTFVFIFFAHLAFSANIGIVESQSFHPLQVMDTKWETIVTTMGHTATILPQTSLDDIDNLAGYDVLVVTNGLIMMPVSRQEVIRDYVAQGGNVYIQAEYQVTEPGNEIFEYVVTQLGATFSWTGEANGSLTPMNVFGDLAEGNAPISAIDHYWYGAYGSGGDHIIPFLEYENKNYGFIFCSTNPAHGKVITTSDQDWIRLGYNPELVQNMVDYLTANSNITIPSIFVSVSDTEPCDGEPVTFTANVGSTPSSITYQWMVNNVAILGATDVSFTSVFNNGDLVNCQITFSESCASEQVLTPPLEILTIFPLGNPPVLTVSTASTTICSTESVTAFATVTNIAGVNNMTYQWMLNGQEILGATSAVFQINTMNDGDVLNCIMAYDAPCSNSNQVVATPITFTVNTSMTPLVTISSDFANICAGESIDFSANVAQISSTPTYQWMVDGVAVGTDAPLFTTSSLTDGQTVTCIVTSNDACATIPTATSNALVINVS
ncbi:MAG TPA: hypothetical protein ENJ53_02510, partial [Phaeodactylibacter sp.]|nr:hypothetical protein [Phaeodactylibacter sp.]